jgi:hypothetical protein
VRLEPEFTYTPEPAAPQVVGLGPYGLRQVLAVTGVNQSIFVGQGRIQPGPVVEFRVVA